MAPATKQKRHEEAGGEAADMGHVGDAADVRGLVGIGDRADAAEELENDPQAKHDDGRHGDDLLPEQDVHPRLREHKDVGAEHAGDGARGADVRYGRCRAK